MESPLKHLFQCAAQKRLRTGIKVRPNGFPAGNGVEKQALSNSLNWIYCLCVLISADSPCEPCLGLFGWFEYEILHFNRSIWITVHTKQVFSCHRVGVFINHKTMLKRCQSQVSPNEDLWHKQRRTQWQQWARDKDLGRIWRYSLQVAATLGWVTLSVWRYCLVTYNNDIHIDCVLLLFSEGLKCNISFFFICLFDTVYILSLIFTKDILNGVKHRTLWSILLLLLTTHDSTLSKT